MPPKILIIEDDAGLRRAIASTFERLGYEVQAAEGGTEGLALFEAAPVDLVITDIFMPDLDGVEVILALGKGRRPPPIVAMSGAGMDGTVLAFARTAGADAVVAKPLSMSNLVRVAQTLLETAARATA